MDENLQRALEEFEQLVRDEDIDSFYIYIDKKSLLLKAKNKVVEQEVFVSKDMLQTLYNFFGSLKCIECYSYDYTSL
ncbi:hypothetical protein [Pontibacter harenae]|uniref:hypothetical protein n=1 Tax=Pontibacter harenae TaxID=2894083 RepID=UPI001E43F950|nr:hypothetical protein [Pontibacter harenae]MCC9168059.1 hypothetical protein [Pontibacter harenae]